jgi:predicted amidophosphoribosyltransferase
MPVCPNCNYEYVEGAEFCPDCQMRLVDESEVIKPEEWTEENWEVVYTSSNRYEVL